MQKLSDEHWMSIAFEEALKAQELGEVPVGAVIVNNDGIVAKAHNQPISKNDPTSHAEINAIRIAAKKLSNYRLSNCNLYVTLEPCAMCYGAIVQSRISKVIFGAFDKKTGVCGSCQNFENLRCFNHLPEIKSGVLEYKCSILLSSFFKSKRN